jgi:hypothetical protein
MEGLLLSVGVVAVLVGLGALVEAARPRQRGTGRRRKPPSWLVRAIPTFAAWRQ